ncbi:hypothetical protein JMUB7524_27400 [Staphylococcus aureus]
MSASLVGFFKQKTAYEICACLVGSEMCIRDSVSGIQVRREAGEANTVPVSYTHLTLPTNREV